MKTEWLSARSELEELRLRKASIEDALSQEREEHLQAIENLREDCKSKFICQRLLILYRWRLNSSAAEVERDVAYDESVGGERLYFGAIDLESRDGRGNTTSRF